MVKVFLSLKMNMIINQIFLSFYKLNSLHYQYPPFPLDNIISITKSLHNYNSLRHNKISFILSLSSELTTLKLSKQKQFLTSLPPTLRKHQSFSVSNIYQPFLSFLARLMPKAFRFLYPKCQTIGDGFCSGEVG